MDDMKSYDELISMHCTANQRKKVGSITIDRINGQRSDFWVCANVVMDALGEYEIQILFDEMTKFIKESDARASEISTIEWEDVCDCGDHPNTHTHFRGTGIDNLGRSIWVKPEYLCEK